MFLNLSPPAPPSNGGTVFGPDMCGVGSTMVDGVCIGDPSTYGPIGPEIFAPDPNVKILNLSPPTNGGTVFDVCPPGSMMVDGVCAGDGGAPLPVPVPVPVPVPTPNTGISPALILAVAAAFFFAG
jgi:hypothetical protein